MSFFYNNNIRKWKNILIVVLFIMLGLITWQVKIYPYSFKKSTQVRLTTLVSYIEMYKKIHGTYPDSLKSILIYAEGLHAILDNLPKNGRSQTKTRLFEYKKLRDGYILFSTGVDNLPNTKDDIIPDINILDTSKLGLIIK